MDVSRLSSLRAAIAVFAFVAAHGCGSLLQGQQTQTDVFPSATTSTQTTQAAGTGASQEKQSTEPATKEASPKSEADTSVVELGPGDLIEISVYGVPELNTKTRITNNGDVYLPFIDYVHVADLNINEAQTLIQKRLDDGGFVRNPHVTIFVDESASQGATVLGEVVRPGIYPVLGDRRLYD